MEKDNDKTTNTDSSASATAETGSNNSKSYSNDNNDNNNNDDDPNPPRKDVIAVEGCAHGELDKIYASLEEIERRHPVRIRLLLCCGDFQAVRNEADLNTMACPPKYRSMNSFYKYYCGEKRAPYLTLFIGGNHEATAHLYTLPYGGWVAPNIFYVGAAGVYRFGGLRIGGISGIYKHYTYKQGHWEHPPFTENNIRSVYHQRAEDVFRLSQIVEHINIFMSHDWPRGVTRYGDEQGLLRFKKHFAPDIHNNALGSPACEHLLHTLQPTYWFSAHLHCKFAAIVRHATGKDPKATRFLALDKVLPTRQFLQVIDVGLTDDLTLRYDPEWLGILRLTHSLSTCSKQHFAISWTDSNLYRPNEETLNDLRKRFSSSSATSTTESEESADRDIWKIPENFVRTVKPYDAASPGSTRNDVHETSSPQTLTLVEKLGIASPFPKSFQSNNGNNSVDNDHTTATEKVSNPEEISLDDEDDDEMNETNDSGKLEGNERVTEEQGNGEEGDLEMDEAEEDKAGSSPLCCRMILPPPQQQQPRADSDSSEDDSSATKKRKTMFESLPKPAS